MDGRLAKQMVWSYVAGELLVAIVLVCREDLGHHDTARHSNVQGCSMPDCRNAFSMSFTVLAGLWSFEVVLN